MAELTAFPALAQAKKLFLRRKHAERQHEKRVRQQSKLHQGEDGTCSKSPIEAQTRQQEPAHTFRFEPECRYSSALASFCLDFDEQLRLINSDLLLMNTAIRREYHRESLVLENLTSKLLDDKTKISAAPATVRYGAHSRQIRICIRKPRIKLQIVRRSGPSIPYSKPPSSPKSRFKLLTHKAVEGSAFQSCARMYLYQYLYRGGPTQFLAARELATRCRRLRAFWHWRKLVTQHIKLRLRCRRAQGRIERIMDSWARSRAINVVETEGRYAMAKMFYQSKLVANSFQMWLGWYDKFTVRVSEPMAISGTLETFSIVTLDGYVSPGKPSHSSIYQDHAMLQDFAAYLELRLKCVNMSMLRRIFADFLNGQENTLVPMMQLGSTIITMYPVLRTSFKRRHQAKALLSKPKHSLDARGCVFLYLHFRAATRNMALLKQLFLEFVCRREVQLLAFVERGSQVISVIPFELPQTMPSACPLSLEHQKSTQEAKIADEQQNCIQEIANKRRKRKGAVLEPVKSLVSADAVAPLPAQERRLKKKQSLAIHEPVAARNEPSVTTKRKRKTTSLVSLKDSFEIKLKKTPPVSSPASKPTLKRVKKAKASTKLLQNGAVIDEANLEVFAILEPPPPVVRSPLKCGRKSKASKVQLHDAAAVAAMKLVKKDVVDSVAKSPLKCGRKLKTSRVSQQDAAFVAAMELFEVDETSSMAKTPPKRGSKAKASDSPLSSAKRDTAFDVFDIESNAKSITKGGRTSKASSVSLHQTSPLSAKLNVVNFATKRPFKRPTTRKLPLRVPVPARITGRIDFNVAASIVEPTMDCGKKKDTSSKKLHNAAPAIALQEADSAFVEPTPKSPLNCGRKVRVSDARLHEAAFTAAIESGGTTVAKSKRGELSKVLHDLPLVIATETFKSGIAELAAPKTSNCEEKSSRSSLQSTFPKATIESADLGVARFAATSDQKPDSPPMLPLEDIPTVVATEGVEKDVVDFVSTFKCGRKPESTSESLQSVSLEAATELAVSDGAKSSVDLRRGRPPEANKVLMPGEASVAASGLESTSQCGDKSRASKISQQDITLRTLKYMADVNVTHSVAASTSSVSKTSSVSLQEAASVGATIAESPFQRGGKLNASNMPVLSASTEAAMKVVDSDMAEPTNACNSPVTAMKADGSNVPFVNTVQLQDVSDAAMTSVNSARIIPTCDVGFNCSKTLETSFALQEVADRTEITETADCLVTRVAGLAKSVPAPKFVKAVAKDTSPAANQSTSKSAMKPMMKPKAAMDLVESIGRKENPPAIESTPMFMVQPVISTASSIQSPPFEAETELVDSTGNEVSSPAVESISTRVDKPKTGTVHTLHDAAHIAPTGGTSVLAKIVSQISGKSVNPKRGDMRKSDATSIKETIKNQKHFPDKTVAVNELHKPDADRKASKRGKPVMCEKTCRSQLDLAHKMELFEAQAPWEAVFHNLPAPFDKKAHPTLARQFHSFWAKHSRAVWERNFWAPVLRKLNLIDFNKRNNRQLAAKNAFESLIISAFKELGAAFFVRLDLQEPRHPGWWYRGPVVALFAFQLNMGEEAMWEYVVNEAFKRFPDCKQPLPLSASNSGAMRIRHEHESASMWMTNHHETANFLQEITTLKAASDAGQKCVTST